MNILKNKGYSVQRNVFTKTEILKFEKNLILFIFKFCKSKHKKISNKARLILDYKEKEFRLGAIKLLEYIEIKNKTLFYEISKECTNFHLIDYVDQNNKIQSVIKKFFGKNYNAVQRKKPIMLFNKKNLSRLKYLWHQESQFYPNHRLGLHIWFPVFRNVKSNNDGGMIFALNGFKKNYKFSEIKLKNGWSQRVPKIDVEKEFQLFSPEINRGDVIFFIGPQLHRSDEQHNNIPRVSFVIRYLSDIYDGAFKPIE